MPSLTTYKLLKQEHDARRGEFKTVHGTVQTPAFQNVATAGAIKGGLSAQDLKDIGAQVMLCNTYHLHLRPGDEKIKALGYAIKLDTNGAFPEQLEAVVRAGLTDYVAMDIKNSPARYAETAAVPELALTPIFRSVSFLLRATVDYEFRTTAVAELHDDASFVQLGDWLMGAKRYFIQCFEPRETVLQAGLHAPSEMQLHRWAELVRPKIPAVEIRGI